MTRQFPAAYDVAEYDNRLTSWYNMASQSPKRVIFLLDLSTNMNQNNKIAMAQAIVSTLLDTLIPEDLVNVIFIDDDTSVYKCFQQDELSAALVPASISNVASLKSFVVKASVGGSTNQIVSAVAKATQMLEETDLLIPSAERLRGKNSSACDGLRCAPMNEFLIVVSDGGFDVGKTVIDKFRSVSESRPLMNLIGIAVGMEADPVPIQQMTCNMNGLFFHIKGIPLIQNGNSSILIHPSYILNEMSEYFQLVAAPLARNHSLFKTAEQRNALALDVTWGLPQISSDGSQLIVTLALPCFGDSDSSTPRLLGVVAVDLLFLRPGNDIGNSIFSFFGSVVNPPIEANLEYAIVYKQGYGPRSLIDQNLFRLYGAYVGSLDNFQDITHYMYEDYIGEDFRNSGAMTSIISESSGTLTLEMRVRVQNVMSQWKLQPLSFVQENVTFAWRHVQGHPFVVIIRVSGVPGEDKYMSFHSIASRLSRDESCNFTGVAGSKSSCWSLPAHNMLQTVNASGYTMKPASWLYIPPVAYQSIPTYLQMDATRLAPYCGSSGHPACDNERLVNLMGEVNFGISSLSQAGDGLVARAINDIYLTSMIDPLWNETFSSPEADKFLSRMYLTSQSGVFRTLGRPEYDRLTLPFLFQPNQNFWYLGAVGQKNNLVFFPPSSSFFDTSMGNGTESPRVLTMSQTLQDGFSASNNQSSSEFQVAAVIGAEILYQPIHDALYGAERLMGISSGGNNFRCGDKSSIGIIRCIVINNFGVVIAIPEFSINTTDKARKTLSGTTPVFLGNVEPRLTQELVFKKFLVPRDVLDVTVTSSDWGEIEGYEVDESTVPLVADLHGEKSDGVVFISKIQGTNTLMIVIDMYVYQAGVSECDHLTYECPSVTFPYVKSVIEDTCSVSPRNLSFKASALYALLPDYSQERVVKTLQLTDNCMVPLPEWVWQLVLAGAGFVSLVLGGIGIRYLIYRRKRNRWMQKRLEADKMNDNPTRISPGVLGDLSTGGGSVKQKTAKISSLFQTSRKLAQEAEDIDDYRNLIEQQTNLIMTLAADKSLAQIIDDARLDGLGTRIGHMRTLAYNLQDRLKAHEGMRVQSGRERTLKAEVQNLDRQFEDLQRKLEEMVLPSVSIQAGVSAPSQMDSPRSRERQNTLLSEERAFYTSHYPHLFKYEGDGSSTNRRTTKEVIDDEVTDRSMASQSFVHSARTRAQMATQRAEALASQPSASAFFGAAITPRTSEHP